MSDEIKIAGTVEAVLETETFGSGFSKRVLVINTGGDYPQTIPVEFVKDKTSILDDLSKGDAVTAYVNLRGNEYKGKYYANIQGWKLDKGSAKPKGKAKPATESAAPADDYEDDDIPF